MKTAKGMNNDEMRAVLCFSSSTIEMNGPFCTAIVSFAIINLVFSKDSRHGFEYEVEYMSGTLDMLLGDIVEMNVALVR